MYVLDTNVVSELMRPAPSTQVARWIGTRSVPSLFVAGITVAEILYGLRLLPNGRRQQQLTNAARQMFDEDFAGRVLPFDRSAAAAYAEIGASRRRSGRPISQFDAQIAAICLVAKASVVTGNAADFAECGIEVVNPWEAPE